jgi:hypothetical protein
MMDPFVLIGPVSLTFANIMASPFTQKIVRDILRQSRKKGGRNQELTDNEEIIANMFIAMYALNVSIVIMFFFSAFYLFYMVFFNNEFGDVYAKGAAFVGVLTTPFLFLIVATKVEDPKWVSTDDFKKDNEKTIPYFGGQRIQPKSRLNQLRLGVTVLSYTLAFIIGGQNPLIVVVIFFLIILTAYWIVKKEILEKIYSLYKGHTKRYNTSNETKLEKEEEK